MAASLVFRLHERAPDLVREVLLERGWEEYDGEEREEEDWNLYWRGSAFRSSEYHNLLPWQRLNHHPKTVGITRKDYLVRNLRRMRATCGSSLYDFSPTAFILPNDYTRFLAEYKKLHVSGGAAVYWICKPTDLSRGRGIFIFQDIRDLVYDCSIIAQRYVSEPLLISGYKFDLRIYVCVKSFHPLTVYVHQEGLVRFATEKYDLSSLQNLYAHLTNTSINKLGPFYKTAKERVGRGCKWTLSKFRHFLHSQDMDELLLWQRINNIVTLTLLTIAPSIPDCPNCVELFGFDVLIDDKFKPWLLEVNYSPALTLDCQADITVKKGLVSDLIDLMNYTSIDSLRERAYQKRPCFHANQPSHVPVLSKFKDTKLQKTTNSQTRVLPLLKTLHKSMKRNKRQSRRHAFLTDDPRHLPPVDSNKTLAAQSGVITTAATRTHADKTLNLILGPSSRTNVSSVVNGHPRPGLAPWLRDNKSLCVSEVTDHDTAETEAELELPGETDVSSRKPDIRLRRLGSRRSAVSGRLPDIYSGRSHVPSDKTTAQNGERVPPLRVGGFIRTFPFNRATLKASRHQLDVKSVIQEIHKLTTQLTAGQPEKTTGRRETESEDDFDSLFWGPKDPPFISQCFEAT